MFNQSGFKDTDSSLTPEPDAATTYAINVQGTERFIARLVAVGMTLQPDDLYTEETLPEFSVARARRWRNDFDNGLIARGLIVRLTGETSSVAVFASQSGALTSATERAVGRMLLAHHVYAGVIADRGLAAAPHYLHILQAPLSPDAGALTGLRSDLEIIEYLKTRPELSGR